MILSDANRRQQSLALLAVVCLCLLGFTTASAQTFRGSILGTVADPRGDVVPGATVTVKNVDTGIERSTTTDTDGGYLVSELPIGLYSVSVEASGFGLAVSDDVRVDVAS